MVLLDVDFNEGDFLTAGVITSTSSVNGITTTVNSNTLTKLAYETSDLTAGTISNNTSETTLAALTIPADTFLTGALYMATIEGEAASSPNTCTFKIKSGVSSSEVLRHTRTIYNVAGERSSASLLWYDDAPTFTGNVSVIITGQNSDQNVNSKSTVHTFVILGY